MILDMATNERSVNILLTEMTGKDLILYILQNDLLEVSVFRDGHFLNCLTIPEAAVHYRVGEATIRTWLELGMIKGIQLGTDIYVPKDAYPKDCRYPVNIQQA